MTSPIVVYGRLNSANVQKVMWAAAELGITLQQVDAGGAFELNAKNPKYTELNPNGLVPTIDDNGFVLWESNAIVRYLYTVHKPAASIQQNATEEQWMEWSRDVTDCVGLIFRQLIRTSPEQRDEASIQRAQIKADHLFSLLDAQLQSREYVAGKEFSKADIVVAVNAHRYFNLPISRPSLPNLEAWLRRVAQREGYKTYVAIPLT